MQPSTSLRTFLRALSRQARSGLITVAAAATAWGIPARPAALRLARLANAGWLVRARRGVYYLPPLEAGLSVAVDDPWILADTLFAPCYIGGWSAAEHWALTEQLFRSTLVATAANIRQRDQTLLGAEFRLVRISRERVASVAGIWRGRTRVRVSGPERTLVDALVDPAWVGGIRHLADMIAAYRDSPGASDARLADDLRNHGNGAAHKRAGFLAQRFWPEAVVLLGQAAAGRSTGIIRLDPSVSRRGRMNRRWGLWINATVPASGAAG